MTLRELEPLSREFSFGDARLHLRYDMRALLELEKAGLSYTDIFSEKLSGKALLCFLHAGLCENAGAAREEEILKALGAGKVWELCLEAVLLALPEPDPLIIPDAAARHSGGIDHGVLRCYVCDIMRKPEEFFWSSTLRELLARWERYAVFKGYMKPPERMELYDTEGMDE